MAARKVSPAAEGIKDVEADYTKAETVPLGPIPHAPTLHHLATREPHSFHQTTIYYGLERQDTPPRRKYGLLAASIGIVFLQCFVASGLSVGVTMSTCRDNRDCGEGTYCELGICESCESEFKHCCHTNSTESCPAWAEKVKEPMCANCVTDRGFESFGDIARERVDSMMIQDWLALFLASLVVAFAVFAEMRDAMLCEIALREISKQREVPRGWRYAIRGLNYARYFFLLPNIILSDMALVYEDGGRVKYVCLNTVAVLFLLEVDNLAFLHGLGERTRMEAEQKSHAGARVTEEDLRIMGVVKLICVVLIPCSVFVGVCSHSWVRDQHDAFNEVFNALPSIAVLFVQRVMASRRKLKGACGGFGWAILNYSMYGVWGGLFYAVTYMQAHGPEVVLSWGPLPYVLAAMLALTLVISILTDSPPSPSTASSGLS